jgi:copper chaperone CopZ
MAVVITIGGMTCGGCVTSVKNALARASIADATVELGKARLSTGDEATVKRAREAIEKAGFDVREITPSA